MIEKYSIRLFKPDWPHWLIWIVDQILFVLPILKVGKANRILRRLRRYKGPLFIEMLATVLGISVRIKGRSNIPKQGAAIIVCNHPGKADVIAMLKTLLIECNREDTVILANKFICIKNVKKNIIPVDTLAPKGKKVPMEEIEQALIQGKLVVIFPYGLDSRYDDQGVLCDLDWKATFVDLAIRMQVPVIITHIGGTQNSELFHRVARFRQRSKLLKNIPLELAFLLRELVYAKSDVTIIFTREVAWQFLDQHVCTTADKKRMAEVMRKYCYKIASMPHSNFGDYYFC